MRARRRHKYRFDTAFVSLAGMILAAGLVPGGVGAQTAFGLKWFGEVRPPSPPRMLALGGLSAVAPWGGEPAAVGQGNPALMAWADRVLYGFTWELGHLSGSYPDGEGSLWQTGPRMVGLVLPLGGGVAVGGRLQSYTASEFEVHTSGEAPGGVPVRFNYIGTGGLSLGAAGIAWRPPSGVASVGIEGEVVFGSLKQEWRTDFEPLGYADTSDRLQRQHLGSRWRLGVQLAPASRLRLGAAVSSGLSLDVKYIRVTSRAEADTSEGEVSMGGSVIVGAGWLLNDVWAVYADYRGNAWDETEWVKEPASAGGEGAVGFNGFSADRDIGVGIERRTRPPDEQFTFWDSLPLRAGLRWGSVYAPDLDGGRISQWYGTLGTAQTIGREGRAWMDLALVFGRRTSAGAGGATEGFWRIQIGITGAERWFLPPQR